jgi:hypothetical protein
MTHAMAAYTWCEWEYGVPIPPTNSALGVTLPESKLGRVFLAKGRNADEVRLVRIVRNDSGVVLAKRKLVRYDTGAGDYLKSIAGVTNADAGPVAGMVEEGYDSGVKIGHWFRLVVFCQNIGAILADANSARIALNPGDRIVCNTNGEFWKESITDPTDAPATATRCGMTWWRPSCPPSRTASSTRWARRTRSPRTSRPTAVRSRTSS